MKKLLPLLAAPLLLTACDPLTLALGAGGGYVASREVGKASEKQERASERRVEREQQYYQQQDAGQAAAEDQRIAAQMALGMLGGGLTNVLSVTADVRGGVVTLYGTVPSPAVADRAVDIARRTPGVREVVSRLNVMEMQITPTGRAWGHVARPPQQAQQQPPQQMQAPQGQQGQQGNAPVASAVPPQAIEPPAYPEKTPGFMPMMEPEQKPEAQNAGASPQPMPAQGYGNPAAPLQQGYAPPPQPQGYQEPAGTVPRTLQQVEEKK